MASFVLDQQFSNLSVRLNALEDLLKHPSQGPIPRVSASGGLGWAQDFAFLTSFQMVRMLLFQGPHLGKTGTLHEAFTESVSFRQ